MNFLKMRNSFLTIALLGLFIAGCNENDPTDPTTDEVKPVTNLMASSDNGQVRLSWTASATSGVVYEISIDDVVKDSDVTGTSYTATGLTNGTVYKFEVTAVDATDADEFSTTETINWAPAARFGSDKDEPAKQLQIFEKDSQFGSGLAIDTRAPFNGPANVSLSAANPADNPRAQIALFVEDNNTTFRFGPAAGFSVLDYANRLEFDQDVVISDTFFIVDVDPTAPLTSFDDWYLDEPLSSYVTGNRKTAYTNLADRSTNEGYGFIVRTGSSAADYHYARVLVVPGTNGKILQQVGTDTDEQYITVYVSYQEAANIPYAKQ